MRVCVNAITANNDEVLALSIMQISFTAEAVFAEWSVNYWALIALLEIDLFFEGTFLVLRFTPKCPILKLNVKICVYWKDAY